VLSGLLLAALVVIGSDFIATLRRLDAVERERDQWQRPAEVIQALGLQESWPIWAAGRDSFP
jgi:hypothetical protein